MSLIPSESHSFPDDFSRSISRARAVHDTRRFIDQRQAPAANGPSNNLALEAPRAANGVPELVEIDVAAARSHATLKKRRRAKAARFVVWEAVALAVLGASFWIALSNRLAEPTLLLVTNIATIAAAAAVVILPIVYFAVGSMLPRVRR